MFIDCIGFHLVTHGCFCRHDCSIEEGVDTFQVRVNGSVLFSKYTLEFPQMAMALRELRIWICNVLYIICLQILETLLHVYLVVYSPFQREKA